MAYAAGDQVGVIHDRVIRRVLGGPFTVVGPAGQGMYRLSTGSITNAIILVPWTDDTVLGQIQPGYAPPMAPAGAYAVGQEVHVRFEPVGRNRIIAGGPYLINGQVHYETDNGRSIFREADLMLPGAAPVAPVAAAAPANIYAGVPHEGERNVPANAENAIFMSAIEPGTEMVNFHGESGLVNSRYYTLNGFRQLPMKMFPGVGRFKENPYTRQPIRPANVTRYRKTGGKRQRKGASRKNRRTRRR
jgi:hypothetical protein